MQDWQFIGKVQSQELTESRLQLHYEIQFIAAAGAALAEPLPDYSHTSLDWNPTLEVFVGCAIRAAQPFQVALDPTSLTIILLDQQNQTLASQPLHGSTLAAGLSWLQQEITKMGTDGSKIEFLDYPPDDFPDHALAHGGTFNASLELALSDLTDYYANTDQLLQDIIAQYEDASAMHLWPHHCDLALLIMLPGLKDGHPLTVGVGLSPGDASYDEPYWYVSPYPYPDPTRLPDLDGGGFWHTQHWVGAVLRAAQVTEQANADGQQQQVESFLNSALNASISLLTPASWARV
jgi:hypothetical protein